MNENFTNCKTVTTAKVNILNLILFSRVIFSAFFFFFIYIFQDFSGHLIFNLFLMNIKRNAIRKGTVFFPQIHFAFNFFVNQFKELT